ncbi:MAG: hypothetical protein JRI93_05335 [Deltaproteobacteria bacterium]|nr:hypothetical protein [Deltaproteobacteria bacterium]
MNTDPKSMQTEIVEKADLIYYGGDIVTINDAQPSAEALAVKDGTILAVGAADKMAAFKGSATNMWT